MHGTPAKRHHVRTPLDPRRVAIDGRSKQGHLVRHLAILWASKLGGWDVLDEQRQREIIRAAELTALATKYRGEAFTQDGVLLKLARTESLARRAVRDLMLDRKAQPRPAEKPKAEGPTLRAYLAQQQQAGCPVPGKGKARTTGHASPGKRPSRRPRPGPDDEEA